jgi:UDPglucose 6-dehydrogenase
MDRFRSEHGDLGVICCDSVDQAAADCDALILATEWPLYRDLNWDELARGMRSAIMLDTRNALDRERLVRNGFRYVTIAGLEGSGDSSQPLIAEPDLMEAGPRR